MELIAGTRPAPRVAFSTRLGGVSDGDFRSLNLGLRTEDEPDHVIENRRRLRRAAAPTRSGRRWHGSARRARHAAQPAGFVTPGTVWERCDGLWTDEPGQP